MDRLSEIETRKKAIYNESQSAKGEALNTLTSEMKALVDEEIELRKEMCEAEKRQKIANMINNNEIETNNIEDVTTEVRKNMNNKFETIEYRQAFMDYVISGTPIPVEYRDNAVSVSSENTAVIPATTLNSIIEKMDAYGEILPLVKKLAYPAGVVVPTSTLAVSGTWIATEGSDIETSKKATVGVTFGAYELACAISVSFKAHIQSLSAFESAVIENVSRAMVKALENAIINGTGSGQPLGILSVTHANTPMTPENIPSVDFPKNYKGLMALLKAIPSAYSNGSVIVLNSASFYELMSISDSAGHPIARINAGLSGAPEYMVLGKKVVITDYLPSIDSATAGATVGFVFNFDNYVLNTAYNMDLYTYIDNASRNRVYQSVGMYDGKVVDGNGLVFIKKPTTSAT